MIVYSWCLCEHGSLRLCEVLFFMSVSLKLLCAFLNVVLWLIFLVIGLLVYSFDLVLSTLVLYLGYFYSSGIIWGCAYDVASLIVPNFHF